MFQDIFFLVFLGPYLQHMEVPRLGVESELQLLAYATATAAPDMSHDCDLHQSSGQCWILNPLSHQGTPRVLFHVNNFHLISQQPYEIGKLLLSFYK